MKTVFKKYPALGDNNGQVMLLQKKLNLVGASPKLVIDGQFGPKTKSAVKAFQKEHGLAGTGAIGPLTFDLLDFELESDQEPAKVQEIEEVEKPKEVQEPIPVLSIGQANPAYVEAKKYIGKTEKQAAFNKFMSQFWGKVGLPGYKTIIGTSFAWCGLFIAAMNSEVGQSWIKNGAGARNWAKYGQEVNWKKDGIPQGAVIHINGNGNCSSGSGNHVTFSDGACTAIDLARPSAVVPGLGGNQSNTVKVSNYPVKNICAVRWPSELPLPRPVTQSINCGSGKSSNESTR